MKKKLLVFLLAVVILVGVYGCSVTPSQTVTTNPATSSNIESDTVPTTTEETLPWDPSSLVNYMYSNNRENPDHTYEITRQVLPETVDNPEGLPVVKWVCLVNTGEKVWNEAAVGELNQMLADKGLPYRVQFILLSANKGHLLPWDWFTNPEVQKELEDADLIYGYYTAQDMEEWLLPITDHVYGDAQPTIADTLPDPLSWFSFEANGELYGIPRIVNKGVCSGWRVDSDFMEKFELTVEDFQKNFWEMDELFAEIYEKNGNQPFLKDEYSGNYGGIVNANSAISYLPMGSVFKNSAYQGICLNFSIDLQAEKPTVVNMLETELFSTVHDAALRYQKAGYMSGKNEEICFAPDIGTSESYLDASGKYYRIPCTPMGLPSLRYAYMTGIRAKSDHQEQALSLLEQVMTDDTLRLQLCYGKEGRDYALEEGNIYSLITQEDGSCYYMDFLSPQATFFEFTSADTDTSHLLPSTADYNIVKREGKTRLESYKMDIAQASFSYCPIVFDLSDLDAELTALEQVLNDYYPMFADVEYYSEEYFQRMIRDMKEAGMDTVITELQRQLDAWIAEHPDWNPLS